MLSRFAPSIRDLEIKAAREEMNKTSTSADSSDLETAVRDTDKNLAITSLEYQNLIEYTRAIRLEVLEAQVDIYYLFFGTERNFKLRKSQLDASLMELNQVRENLDSLPIKVLSHERYDVIFKLIGSIGHKIGNFRKHFNIFGAVIKDPFYKNSGFVNDIKFVDYWKWFVEFLTSDKPPKKIIATQYERETAAGLPLSIGKYEQLIYVINNKRPAICFGGYNSHFTLEAHCEIREKIETLALQITEAERVGNESDYCSLLKQRDQLENDIRSINAKYDKQNKLEWEKLDKQKSEERKSKQISPQIAYVVPATAPLPQAQVQGTQVNSQTSTYNPSGDYRYEVMISDRNDKAREKAERKREREEEKWYRQQRRQDYERRKYERNAGKPRHKWT